MASNPRQTTSADLSFFFHAQEKPFEFLLHKTSRLHFLCVYCNRSQKTSLHACKEQQSRHSTSSCVVRFCSLHAVTSSVIYYSTNTRENVIYFLNIQYTHTEKSNLFINYLPVHIQLLIFIHFFPCLFNTPQKSIFCKLVSIII